MVPPVHVHYFLCNGKSQSSSSCTAGAGLLYTVKFIENKRKLVCRDHISIVGNRNCYCFAFCMDLHQDPLSIRPVLDGIANQVIEQTGKQIAVSCYDFTGTLLCRSYDRFFSTKFGYASSRSCPSSFTTSSWDTCMDILP